MPNLPTPRPTNPVVRWYEWWWPSCRTHLRGDETTRDLPAPTPLLDLRCRINAIPTPNPTLKSCDATIDPQRSSPSARWKELACQQSCRKQQNEYVACVTQRSLSTHPSTSYVAFDTSVFSLLLTCVFFSRSTQWMLHCSVKFWFERLWKSL